MKLGKYARQLQNSYRENRGAFIVYSGLRLLVLLTLIRNLVGAVVFSVIGYSTLKFSKSSKVADSLVIKPKEMV